MRRERETERRRGNDVRGAIVDVDMEGVGACEDGGERGM